MNDNLLNVVKEIVSEYGESVLSEPRRISAFLADLAHDEPKAQKYTLVKCLEIAVVHREDLYGGIYPEKSFFNMDRNYQFPAEWDWTVLPCNTALLYGGVTMNNNLLNVIKAHTSIFFSLCHSASVRCSSFFLPPCHCVRFMGDAEFAA